MEDSELAISAEHPGKQPLPKSHEAPRAAIGAGSVDAQEKRQHSDEEKLGNKEKPTSTSILNEYDVDEIFTIVQAVHESEKNSTSSGPGGHAGTPRRVAYSGSVQKTGDGEFCIHWMAPEEETHGAPAPDAVAAEGAPEGAPEQAVAEVISLASEAGTSSEERVPTEILDGSASETSSSQVFAASLAVLQKFEERLLEHS